MHALGFITHDEVSLINDWNVQVRKWRSLPRPPPPELSIKELRIQRRVIELRIEDFSQGTRRIHLLRQAECDLPLMDARIAKALDEIANPTPLQKPQDPPTPLPPRIGLILDLSAQVALAESRLASELAYVSLRTEQGLDAADVELCKLWANISDLTGSISAVYSLETLVNSEGSYRACQLLSARTAEHIATNYYVQLGHTVTDVSGSQNLGGNEDWKTFDLRVDTRPVDVKNARESFNGNGNFVEHCVPRFKSERASSSAVRVLGIVSTYIVDCKNYLKPGSEALVLGEVNATDIKELCDWANHRFGPSLDLQAIWRPHFIPGWLFEYPHEHYSRRVEEIAAIPSVISSCLDVQIPADTIPG